MARLGSGLGARLGYLVLQPGRHGVISFPPLVLHSARLSESPGSNIIKLFTSVIYRFS